MTGASDREWWRDGLEIAASVDGWMQERQLVALMTLARSVQPDAKIVEIGTYRGRSTVALALGSREGGGSPVYTFDPHLEFLGARGGSFGPADQIHLYRALTEAGVGDRVFVVCLDSRWVAPNWPTADVGLLVIDGDHREDAVRADFEAWWPSLREDAVVVFDDSDYQGVARVIETLKNSGRLEALGEEDGLTWFSVNT